MGTPSPPELLSMLENRVITGDCLAVLAEGDTEQVAEVAGGQVVVVVLAPAREVDQADGARVMGILEGDESGLKVGARVRGEIKPPAPKSKKLPLARMKATPSIISSPSTISLSIPRYGGASSLSSPAHTSS